VISNLPGRCVFLLVCLPAASSAMDVAVAQRYFEQARAACEADNGRLWGVSLCGPMMFADRQSRGIITNQADAAGVLKKEDGVYTGRLPESVNIANTAVTWSGTRWTQIALPLPGDDVDRLALLMHESFHRIQNQLGFKGAEAANAHLDSVDGRVLMQLEWRALTKAIGADGRERQQAITDALLFRAQRRSWFPRAGEEEGALERTEGLAEYTGVKLAGDPAVQKRMAAKALSAGAHKPSYVRSFAYASGPAYGLLLDETAPARSEGNWRKKVLAGSDLGTLLQAAYSVKLARDLGAAVEDRSMQYDGGTLKHAETVREENRQRLMREYRASLVDGPTISIPLRHMSIQFNPDELFPLGEAGTVYPTLRVSDVWGILTSERGALMDAGWQRVSVAAPRDASTRPIRGDGWTLDLKPGWTIEAIERQGSFVVKEEKTGGR
jgi:hypothetical protein